MPWACTGLGFRCWFLCDHCGMMGEKNLMCSKSELFVKKSQITKTVKGIILVYSYASTIRFLIPDFRKMKKAKSVR